jgi:hypothetical protein
MPCALVLLLLLIPAIGAVIVLVGRVSRSREQARLQARFGPMSLPDLQKATPSQEVRIIAALPNERTTWFEALLEKTFAQPVDWANDSAFLTRQYVGMLGEFMGFLTTTFPTVWSETEPDKPAELVLGKKDVHYHVVVWRTLEWFGFRAKRQNELVAADGREMPAWDSSLFLLEVGQQTKASGFQTITSLRTQFTLARMREEARRLGQEAPALAAVPIPAATVTSPVPAAISAAGIPAVTPTASAAVAPAVPRRRFLSAWTLWSFVPWLMWLAWVHAAIRTRLRTYLFFAIPYAVPLVLAVATAKPGAKPPDWLLAIQGVLWLAAIVHVQLARKSINRRIAERLGLE